MKILLNCLMQYNHNNSMLCYRRLHGRVMVKLCIFNRTTNGGCDPGLWCKIREYYNQTTKLFLTVIHLNSINQSSHFV